MIPPRLIERVSTDLHNSMKVSNQRTMVVKSGVLWCTATNPLQRVIKHGCRWKRTMTQGEANVTNWGYHIRTRFVSSHCPKLNTISNMKNVDLICSLCVALVIALILLWMSLRLEPMDGGFEVLLTGLASLIAATLVVSIYVVSKDSK